MRFVHVQRLREDPTRNERFGLERVVSDDTLRRFAASGPEAEGAALITLSSRQRRERFNGLNRSENAVSLTTLPACVSYRQAVG